jgi:endonuclease/exonuclease/phosphatase family metal-dependent hydrolase
MRRTLASLVLAVTLSACFPGLAFADDAENGYYIDSTGKRVEFRPTYEGWFGDSRYRPQVAKAIASNAALLGFELFLYWYDPNQNSVDWQYPNLGKKFTSNELVRFDDNKQFTNFTLHPIAGGAHYGMTRLSGMNVPVSFGAAAISSALYEFVFEWLEVVSINDLIVTPIAGAAVGETFFQLGNYLNSEVDRPRTLDETVGAGEFGRNMAQVTVGLPRKANDAGDTPRPLPRVADDSLGYSSAYWHDFRLSAGQSLITNDLGDVGQAFVLRERTELIAMPGLLRTGYFSVGFHGGNFTSTDVKLAISGRLREADMTFDTHLFGYLHQDIAVRDGGLHGQTVEIGGRVALHYKESWYFDRHDYFGIVHILGPATNFWTIDGPLRLRLGGDIAPDFASIAPPSYEEWVARYGSIGTKSSLLLHGYYNAWGVSTGVTAAASMSGFTLQAMGRIGHYESIDGLEPLPLDRLLRRVTESSNREGLLDRTPASMHRHIVAYTVPLVVACGPAPLEPRDPTPGVAHFRLETYNVLQSEYDDPVTIDAIGTADADIVCLQEIQPPWEARIRERYADQYPEMLIHAGDAANGLAVLSRYPLHDQGFHPSATEHPAWHVLVDTPMGPVQLLDVHLRSMFRGRDDKLESYTTVDQDHLNEIDFYSEKCLESFPTIVAGDFNEEPDGTAVRYLEARGFRNALPLYHPGQGTWRDPQAWQFQQTIDHILFNGAFEPLNSWVEQLGNSDHLPVVVHLEAKSQSAEL